MLSNTKLSTLVLKTHLNFKSFFNYVKENKKKYFFTWRATFFHAVFDLEHKPTMEYTAVSREVVQQKV